MTPTPLRVEVVSMKSVPRPPSRRYRQGSKWDPLYDEIRKCGFDEAEALLVKTTGQKQSLAIQARLKQRARKDGLLLCTSRNAAYTEMYCWLVQRLGKAK